MYAKVKEELASFDHVRNSSSQKKPVIIQEESKEDVHEDFDPLDVCAFDLSEVPCELCQEKVIK